MPVVVPCCGTAPDPFVPDPWTPSYSNTDQAQACCCWPAKSNVARSVPAMARKQVMRLLPAPASRALATWSQVRPSPGAWVRSDRRPSGLLQRRARGGRRDRRHRETGARVLAGARRQIVACHGIPLFRPASRERGAGFFKIRHERAQQVHDLASQSGGLISAITVLRQSESRKPASSGLASGASPTRRSHAMSSANAFTVCGPSTWPLRQSWV